MQALLVVVLGCQLGVGWLAWQSLQTANAFEQWETHTYVVIQELGEFVSGLKDAETGQRGYLITNNRDYLEPYTASLATFSDRLAQLRRLTADNPGQQARLAALTPLVAAKFASLKQAIALRETEGFTAARAAVMTQSGKQLMDQIRLLVTQAVAEEQQLLDKRATATAAADRKASGLFLLCAILGSVAILLLFIRLRREQVSRLRAEQLVAEQMQALADQDRRKDEFLATLGHELRNPLSAVASALQLLVHLQKKTEEPLQRNACGIIARQVGQLNHLVDDLLDVSRISTGALELRQARVCLNDIAQAAVETVQPLILKRRHALAVSLPQPPLWLQADAVRIEQVLVNLLTNAAKYTDEGGRIWLSVERSNADGAGAAPPMTVIRVRDSGIGIAPALLPNVFDMFSQAERASERSQGGMGIGLALVRQLVQLHGGSVRVDSVVGQGSEFVVRLPVMD